MRIRVLVLGVLAALGLCPPAGASTLVTRGATDIGLKVDGHGRALVTYKQAGVRKRVLAWGAINDDVKFRLDYAGGYGAFRRPVWKSIKACPAYDGPTLHWLVAACEAPDGSYWALQRWQRMLPNQGYPAKTGLQRARELHLSHWRGELPKLEIYLDWIYNGRYHHLFGRYTYLGKAVHGDRSTSKGVPLDPYGRNVYLDTFNSAYGPGWKRENSFLAHRPRGNFCYGFFPRPSYYDKSRRPAAHGRRYRATAIGPGVSPDPFWPAEGLGAYDPNHEAQMHALSDSIAGPDRTCHQH